VAHQVGGKDKRAVEHGQEQGLLALHVMVDPVGDGLDALLDFVLANKRFEPFVLNLYDTHEYEFNNFSAKLQKI